MNSKMMRNFVVASAFLLIAAAIFAGAESHGKVIESRVGIFGIILIAMLLFFAAWMTPKDVPPPAPPTPTPTPVPTSSTTSPTPTDQA